MSERKGDPVRREDLPEAFGIAISMMLGFALFVGFACGFLLVRLIAPHLGCGH